MTRTIASKSPNRTRCLARWTNAVPGFGIDVVGVRPRKTMFGFENKGWKPFTMFDGTEVSRAGSFQVDGRRPGRLADLSRRRHVGAAERTHARGRQLLRHDHPPGSDRRDETRPGRQPRRVWVVQPGGSGPFRQEAEQLEKTGRGIMLNAPGAALATSPWCPPRG